MFICLFIIIILFNLPHQLCQNNFQDIVRIGLGTEEISESTTNQVILLSSSRHLNDIGEDANFLLY
jgi:hypothetical protein